MQNETPPDKFELEFGTAIGLLGLERTSRTYAQHRIGVGNSAVDVTVEICAQRFVTDVRVDWASYGSTKLDRARDFTTCMLVACELARRCEEAFVGRSWSKQEVYG